MEGLKKLGKRSGRSWDLGKGIDMEVEEVGNHKVKKASFSGRIIGSSG